MENRLGFLVSSRALRQGIYIPKFYSREIESRLSDLTKTHELIPISKLIADGYLTLSTGDEIGKMAYGTGTIPFIRTSDISNWELKTDPKQGVSREIYESFAPKQDMQEGDILVVKDGTYLIGQSCIISKDDLPALYQSHLFKLRILANSPYSPYLIFAALNSPIFKLQIRSVQFTADIIDSIGSRFLDLKLPIPKDPSMRSRITEEVSEHVSARSRLRESIRELPKIIDAVIAEKDEGSIQNNFEPASTTAFKIRLSSVKNGVYIPKFYDPTLESDIRSLDSTHHLVTLQKLVDDGVIGWDTGIEVGKMAYGTGNIPFVRTSDISNWEIKGDPKQGVSEDIYLQNKQDVQVNDIFVVKDGTYLVGSSCIVTAKDTKLLYCGGLYKLRVLKKADLNPYLFLTLLNTTIVRRQMKSKQFTRDIIDTLGKRIFDVRIPIPKDGAARIKIAKVAEKTVLERVALRNRAKQIVLELEGSITDDEREELDRSL